MDIPPGKDRLARWAELLADYNIEVEYIAGKTNIADALSRRPGLEQQTNEAVATVQTKVSVVVPGTSKDELLQDEYFGPLVRHLLRAPDDNTATPAYVPHRAQR